MYKITLSDSSVIDHLERNGNNFVSQKELTGADFKDRLRHWSEDGPDGHIDHGPSELVQIQKYEDGWYFILRDLTAQEILNRGFESRHQNTEAVVDVIMGILSQMHIPGGGQ